MIPGEVDRPGSRVTRGNTTKGCIQVVISPFFLAVGLWVVTWWQARRCPIPQITSLLCFAHPCPLIEYSLSCFWVNDLFFCAFFKACKTGMFLILAQSRMSITLTSMCQEVHSCHCIEKRVCLWAGLEPEMRARSGPWIKRHCGPNFWHLFG